MKLLPRKWKQLVGIGSTVLLLGGNTDGKGREYFGG